MDFRKIQEAQERFGGPFAMTAILQKRVRELVQGSKPLVETDKARPIDIALDELLGGCLSLEQTDETVMPQAPSDIFGSDV
ncbi:MAG: DNA-directed RNA polymerase subunit omega [Planctomycetota bacterium]|jgi:DNA-directed RNA polymerase subunit K/omega